MSENTIIGPSTLLFPGISNNSIKLILTLLFLIHKLWNLNRFSIRVLLIMQAPIFLR